MGAVGTLLSLPVAGPVGALAWLARQIAGNAMEQLLDPARIETALRRLERRLECGEIDEATYDAEETVLLEELAEMRAIRAEMDQASSAPDGSSPDGSPDAGIATIPDAGPGTTVTHPGGAPHARGDAR